MQKNDCYILLYHTPSYVCWSDWHAFRIFLCINPSPPHPSPCPSEFLIWNETSVHIHEVAFEFQNIFFYFQYFMFVILQLFNIILIYMGAVECWKKRAEHECIYILCIIINPIQGTCWYWMWYFFFVIALCNLFFI